MIKNFNYTNQEQYSTEQEKEDLSVSYEQQTTQPKEDFARSSDNASLEHDSLQHDMTAVVYKDLEFTSVSNVPNDYTEQSQNQMVPHHDTIQNEDQAHFDQVHDQDSIHHKQLHHQEVTYYHEQTFIQEKNCIINQMFKITWCIIQIYRIIRTNTTYKNT